MLCAVVFFLCVFLACAYWKMMRWDALLALSLPFSDRHSLADLVMTDYSHVTEKEGSRLAPMTHPKKD